MNPLRLAEARVLVVDDEPDLAHNLEEILEDEGAEVVLAETGARAMELADRCFDVALVDIQLPDANGVTLVPELRRASGEVTETLLITGNASLDDAIEAVRSGAYAYVLKPFAPENLVVLVERAVAKVRLDREAQALARALQHSEASLRTLVDTVQALLLVLDEEGRVVQANQAVSAATGVLAFDLIGRRWMEDFVPPADRAGLAPVFARVIGGESNVQHENRVIRREAGGAIGDRWVRWQSSALRLDSGEIRVYASGLDVTALRNMERRARLSEKLAAVGTMAAGLAHEIRNPLNAASLQLNLLERRLKDHAKDERVQEPLGTVHAELDRLSRLVEDFLRFARPTELRVESIDLVAIARHVVRLESPTAAQRSVSLELIAPTDSVALEGDRAKLEQVILNLVRNALEAVDDGGHVTVEVGRDGAGGELFVRDDGPGIAKEHLNRIFEPFFSTKEGGTGLGMAICHSLITLHGGDIVVRSRNGAEFEVRLPGRPPGM